MIWPIIGIIVVGVVIYFLFKAKGKKPAPPASPSTPPTQETEEAGPES